MRSNVIQPPPKIALEDICKLSLAGEGSQEKPEAGGICEADSVLYHRQGNDEQSDLFEAKIRRFEQNLDQSSKK